MRFAATATLVLLAAGFSPARARQAPDPAPPPRVTAVDSLLLREVTRALAHDSLRGRDTGSPGATAAARYIAERLRDLGLRPPAARGGFTQAVPIVSVSVDPSTVLVADSAVFHHGPDFFLVPGPDPGLLTLAAPGLFLGTREMLAPTGPEDARERILVVLGDLPEPTDSILDAWAAGGAKAVMVLLPDDAAYAAARRALGTPRLELPGTAGPLRPGPPIPVIVAGLRLSRALLAGVTLPPVAGEPPRAAPLPGPIETRIRIRRADVDAVNVVARIPGSDPALRDELVVYTAHYDHLGIGEPDESGDSIYNGFSDNAAGVAMLLGIADAMRRNPPARSVAFLFLTGEERGLLGSMHAAADPPWTGGLARVRAVINLDGGAPPVPPSAWRIAGGLAPDSTVTPLGALADSIAISRGWTTRLETARPNSDYWPFAERGVPAIFIIPGNEWEGTTAGERRILFERWDRYHRPGDEYHEDFPFAGLMRYAGFALEVGRAAAARR